MTWIEETTGEKRKDMISKIVWKVVVPKLSPKIAEQSFKCLLLNESSMTWKQNAPNCQLLLDTFLDPLFCITWHRHRTSPLITRCYYYYYNITWQSHSIYCFCVHTCPKQTGTTIKMFQDGDKRVKLQGLLQGHQIQIILKLTLVPFLIVHGPCYNKPS